MQDHIKIVGILHIVAAAGSLLFGLLLFAFLGTFLGMADLPVEESGWIALVASVIPTLFILLSVPGIAAGFGLLERKPWARVLAMVVSAFQITNLPLGTALAIYTFVVLLDDDAARSFETA